ncbi:MAG TPA: serine/threonine-protein kinase [Polyangiaceae bacterium]
MAHLTYPPGDTTASRIKALALWLRKTRDRATADALVREIRIDAEYLEDETRPIPVATWHKALVAFAARFGRETIRDTWISVIDPENLGVWTRVLRGTVDPEGALCQLDALGGEELKTSRWETVTARPGYWRGRVILSHDPALERDGLCALARSAELVGVPAMFGFGPGTVQILPAPPNSAAAARTGSIAEEYILAWDVPNTRRTVLVAVGCAAAVASPALLVERGLVGASLVTGAGIVAGAIAATRQAGQQRRAESHAQMSRIRALERSVALKEQRERAAVGFFEGSVVAGKYRLGRKLGAGASGVIHQATRLADNAPVALKLLRAAVAHDTVASDRLRREAEALGLTWHPNVVEVFEHDHLPDGTAYLVMEQLDGESLATRLRRAGPLPADEIASVMMQVCDALGAVHAAGVIHRDVKPSNIFLVSPSDGQGPAQVKLLDFGIARVEWAETRLTNMGAPLGTPGYMSPEQEQGGEIDARSDLYAAGAVIYECFTGTPPPTTVSGSFEVSAPFTPVEGPHGGKGPSARIPPEWRPVINRAMAPLPQGRYRDARAMREAIAELLPAPRQVPTISGFASGKS